MENKFSERIDAAISSAYDASFEKIKEYEKSISDNECYASFYTDLIEEVFKSYDFLDGRFHTDNIEPKFAPVLYVCAHFKPHSDIVEIVISYDQAELYHTRGNKPEFKSNSDFNSEVLWFILSDSGIQIFESYDKDLDGNDRNYRDVLTISGASLLERKADFYHNVPVRLRRLIRNDDESKK